MDKSEEEKKSKFNHKIFLAFFFLLLIGAIAYSAFFEDVRISGNVFKEGNQTQEGFIFNASLSSHSFEFKDSFEKLIISGDSDNLIYIEDIGMSLNDSQEIILEDYEGKISFDGSSISVLDGKVNKVYFGNQEMSPKKGGELDIEINKELDFEKLQLINEVYIRNLDYVSSGKINLNQGKNIFGLDEERLKIKDFYGNLNVENKTLHFSGFVDYLKIDGNSNIEISY